MVKTIYNPAYRRLIARIKARRIDAHLTKVAVGRRVCMSRNWVAKIEMCELRLDVLHFVRLCRAYHLKASNLIKDMEEEPSLDDPSLAILGFFMFHLESCYAKFFPSVMPNFSFYQSGSDWYKKLL